MKKLGKILAVLLVMALVLCGVVLTVSADEPAAASAAPAAPDFLPVSVTVKASQIDADALGEATYLVYASEADFNADLADGLLDGEADGELVLEDYGDTATFTMPTTSAYVYLLADVSMKYFSIANTQTIQINCGGRALTTTVKQNNNYGKLAIFNGTFNDSVAANEGTFETGHNPYFAFRDLTFNMTGGWGSGRCIWARNSGCNVYLEGVTTTGNVRRFLWAEYNAPFNVVVKDSDINNKNGFVWLSNATTLNVYLDAATRCSGLIYEGTLAAGQAQTTIEHGFMASATASGSLESASVALNLNGGVFVASGDATYNLVLLSREEALVPTFLPKSVTATNINLPGYTYAVYASKANFEADLADGVLDGMADGTNILTSYGTDTTFTMPTTNAYVYLLANVQTTAASTISGKTIQINLGGHTLTLNSQAGYVSVGSGANIAIFNGSLVDAIHGQGHGSFRGGANFALRDLNMSSGVTWGNAETFAVEANSTHYFENVIGNYTGSGKALFSMNGATANVTFRNVDFYAARTVFAGGSKVTLVADGDCSFKGSVITGAVTNGSVTLDLGVRVDDTAKTSLEASTLVFTENGEATTATGVKFALDGDMYLLQKPGSVSWYATDGSLIRTDVLYTDGFNAPALEGGMTITKTESGYTYATPAWTLDGVAFDLSTRIEPAATYELYMDANGVTKTATLVLLENGVATNAWDITSLNDAFIAELPENSTLLVLTDMAASGGNVASYKNGVVIDLCDNTLTMENCYFLTPVAGATVTVKNGTVTKTTNNTLVYGHPERAGTLVLHDLTINTVFSVAELSAGKLVMELCTINAQSTRPYYIGNGTNATNATLELLGIKHIMPSPSGTVFITINGALGNISVRVADYEGVYSNIRAGYFFQFTGNGTKATEGVTKLNFEFENAYVYGYNAIVTGDIAWDGAANPELTKANVSFTFNNFLGSRYDYLTAPLVSTATVNVTKIKNIYTDNSEGGFETGHAFVTPNPTATGMMINLTLYSDFNLNIYIPTNTDIYGIMVGDAWLFCPARGIGTDEVVDGFYKVSIKNIAPNEAAKYVELGIWYTNTATYLDGTTESYYYNFTAKYSIVKYVGSVIAANDVSKAAKDNAMALAAYVKATYEYFTENAESDEAVMAQLEALVTEEVLALVNSFVAADDANDFVNVKVNAVFTSDATTKLSLTFEDGVAWTVNGRSGVGGTYVVNLRAYNLCDTLTITAGGETATFSLGEYVAARIAGGATGTELAALQALYAYGMTAQAFKPAN